MGYSDWNLASSVPLLAGRCAGPTDGAAATINSGTQIFWGHVLVENPSVYGGLMGDLKPTMGNVTDS
jgi:hypothetical protein